MSPTVLFGCAVGFISLFALTHDTHKRSFKHKLPKIRLLKNFEICPNIKFRVSHYQMHLHHWVALGLLFLILSEFATGLVEVNTVKGFFIGGVAQGLTYKDRFQFLQRV